MDSFSRKFDTKMIDDGPSACRLLSLLGLLLALASPGCDRPFRDVEPPSIRVLEPDLTEVQLRNSIRIRISTESFRTVDRLEINSERAHFDSTSGYWLDTLSLEPGLNAFVLRAFDTEGAVRVDTAYAVYMQVAGSSDLDVLPEPRGGHTSTQLEDGSVLVVGGASNATGEGRSDAFLVFPPSSAIPLAEGLNAARVGHTASRLPDGRVLILGGSRKGTVDELSDLVEQAEIYVPATHRFVRIPVVGSPISRAYHSARVFALGDRVQVDLFGGRGDVSFGGGGRLGLRRDVRTYELRNDTLFSIGSATGGTLLEPLFGHTQTSLTNSESRDGEVSLIVGSRFAGSDFETVSLLLDYRKSGEFPRVLEGPPVLRPRTQHVAVRLKDGIILIHGGRQSTSELLVARAELYIHNPGRYFSVPATTFGRLRFGHAATILADGRILVTGGFGPGSEALSEVSVYSVQL